MREILFRGKRLEIGDWVEGSLIAYPDGDCYIARPSDDPNVLDKFDVDPVTVGQYTGLKDKHGKRIFEGDVVITQPFSDRPYSKKAKFKRHIGVVEHRIHPNYVSEWFVKIENYDGFGCCNWSAFHDCEIISNIHDNRELLGGGGDG